MCWVKRHWHSPNKESVLSLELILEQILHLFLAQWPRTDHFIVKKKTTHAYQTAAMFQVTNHLHWEKEEPNNSMVHLLVTRPHLPTWNPNKCQGREHGVPASIMKDCHVLSEGSLPSADSMGSSGSLVSSWAGCLLCIWPPWQSI